MNVHKFDGEIDTSHLIIEVIDTDVNKLLECNLSAVAKHNLQILIKSLGTGKNYDNSNKINGDELLYMCLNHIDNEDFIKNLNIQLEDMSNGLCPQGRTHRLYQLLLAFQK
jgi:hypothetical protein